MRGVECTIYDCEFDMYYKGLLRQNVVYALDDEGKEVHPKEYVCEYVDFEMVQFYIGDYYEPWTEPEKDNSKWGYFLYSTGEVIVPPIYDYAYPFYGPYAKVEKNKKCGFINYEGKEVVKLMWDDTDTSLYRGLCWVKKADKFGFINKFGVLVISPQFEMVSGFQFIGDNCDDSRYVAIVKKDGKYGFINEKGEYIFKPSFEEVRKFWAANYGQKSYAPVKAFGKWGLMDSKGNLIVEFKFEDIGQEGYFTAKEKFRFYTVKMDGKWGLLNSDLILTMAEDGKNYIIYGGKKIYIKNGLVTSIRKLKVLKSKYVK